MQQTAPHDGDGHPLIEFSSFAQEDLDGALGNDEIASAALHGTTLVLGTRKGAVLALSATTGRLTPIALYSSGVHCIALDDTGRCFFAGLANGTCSAASVEQDDIIMAADGLGETWRLTHGSSPVRSLASCQDFLAKQGDGRLCCTAGDDGRLLLHRRVRFGRPNVLHSGEGPITQVVWRGNFLAWANERGVKVLSTATGQKIAYIPRSEEDLISGAYRLSWATSSRLIMARAHEIKVVSIQQQGDDSLDLHYAEVQRHVHCADVVCGVAAISESNFVVLSANPVSGVSLQLVGKGMDEGSHASVFHEVRLPSLPRGLAADGMHLVSSGLHLPLYVVAPIELIAFQVGDLVQHGINLMSKGLFDEAINLANQAGFGVPTLAHLVCIKSVVPELIAGRFQSACDRLCRIQGVEEATWQECILLFKQFGGLQHLAVHIPMPQPGFNLPKEVYDSVLEHLLETPEALRMVLHWWPLHAFSADVLERKLRESLQGLEKKPADTLAADETSRFEALALLLHGRGDLLAALHLQIYLGSGDIFLWLQKALGQTNQQSSDEIVSFIAQNIESLFLIDAQDAASLLVALRPSVREGLGISVDAATAALERNSRWRHEYLKILFSIDEVAGQAYHSMMVGLFAAHEPRELLAFLKASERYPLHEALEVCRKAGLDEEEAYLLGRDEQKKEALQILLGRMYDVRRAVEFIQEHQDPALWEYLETFIRERPHLLVTLLESLEEFEASAGNFQATQAKTPASLLSRLPKDTKVTQVVSPMKRIFASCSLQKGMHASCDKLILQEMMQRRGWLLTRRKRGCAVAPTQSRCGFCGRLLSNPPTSTVGDFLAATSVVRIEDNSARGSKDPWNAGASKGIIAGSSAGAIASDARSIVLRGPHSFHSQCYRKWQAAHSGKPAVPGK